MDLVSLIFCLNIPTNFSYSCLHFILIDFISVFTDEELDAILDRSDMFESAPKIIAAQSSNHFKVLNSS
jgi:hypothetical protein